MPDFQIFPETYERGCGPYLWGDAVAENGGCHKKAMFLRSHKMAVFKEGNWSGPTLLEHVRGGGAETVGDKSGLETDTTLLEFCFIVTG